MSHVVFERPLEKKEFGIGSKSVKGASCIIEIDICGFYFMSDAINLLTSCHDGHYNAAASPRHDIDFSGWAMRGGIMIVMSRYERDDGGI